MADTPMPTPFDVISDFIRKQPERDITIRDSISAEELGDKAQRILQWPAHMEHYLRSDHIVRMFVSRDITDFASTLSTWRDEWEEVVVVPLQYYLAEIRVDAYMEAVRSLKTYYPNDGWAGMVNEFIETGKPVARVFGGTHVAVVTFTQKAKEIMLKHREKVDDYYKAIGYCPEEVWREYHNLPLLSKLTETTEDSER